ncbi:26S proteasome regulatory subunit p27 [Plasmodium vivax India VII]|uniref:26S proteasome regulatory subunit p27 n=1 Tax=Plasmodium vivax India VII TaxID=1077284 RepID=A0A0J9SDC2_PLAVI|nr:26S proteasome regulatory subunit p27 [Plasmodium vivax India VII]
MPPFVGWPIGERVVPAVSPQRCRHAELRLHRAATTPRYRVTALPLYRSTATLRKMNLDEFNELVEQRNRIEREIQENVNFLEAPENKGVGLHGKLVDEEGFPRNDIDIYSIRVARNKVICLKNDYLNVSKRIEEYLHKVHTSHPVIRVQRSKAKKEEGDDPNESPPESCTQDYDESAPGYELLIEEAKRSTFAMIDELVENSPSHKAGLRINDYIIQFGDVQKKKKKMKKMKRKMQTFSTELQLTCVTIPPELKSKF